MRVAITIPIFHHSKLTFTMSYLLGLDLGTTNTKVLACTPDGEVLAQANRTYPMLQPKPGWRELDPEKLGTAAEEAMGEVIAKMGQAPLAIAISSAMHSLLAIDSDGQPLGNVLTWADSRSAEQARRLRRQAHGQAIYEATGTPIHPMSPLCKLAWMKEHDTARFRHAARFLTIKSWLLFRWTGQLLIDYSDASATGLFDIHHLEWQEDALAFAGIGPEQLPAPVPTTHILESWRQTSREALNLGAGVPIVIGASDGCLANLGSQVLAPGNAALTIGTSGAIRVRREKPLADPRGRLFNYVLDEGYIITGGAVNNGGYALEWFRKELGAGQSLEVLMAKAAAVEPGAGGLLCLPYLLGERAPVWDGRARGAWVGLRDEHGQSHLLRSMLEGICFNLREVAGLIEKQGDPIKEVFASGGFTRSAFWVQLLADIFGRPVCIDASGDASVKGAVILALRALGHLPRLEDAERFAARSERYLPDAARSEQYRPYFELYGSLYKQLRDTFESLARIREER